MLSVLSNATITGCQPMSGSLLWRSVYGAVHLRIQSQSPIPARLLPRAENSLHSGAGGHPLIRSIHRWGMEAPPAGNWANAVLSHKATTTLPLELQFLFLAYLLNLEIRLRCVQVNQTVHFLRETLPNDSAKTSSGLQLRGSRDYPGVRSENGGIRASPIISSTSCIKHRN